jgi:hypothetical protein
MIDADSAFLKRADLRALAAELAGQPRSVIVALVHALRPPDGLAPLDPEVWGRAPGSAGVRTAAADNLALGVARRQAVVRSSITRGEVARALGKSDQAVSAMLERGALLGVKEGREWRIPVWQLDPDRPAGVLPGLREVSRAYRDGVVSLSAWVNREKVDLNGLTPRAALTDDRVDEVIAAAAAE